MNKRLLLLCLALIVILLQGCAGKKAAPSNQAAAPDQEYEETYDEAEESGAYPDSLEGFNRGVFSFNDGFITYIFSPIDTVYTGFFPPDIRAGFGNFYRNLGYPVRLVNALLQFKFDKMAKETASFVLNTTFGWAGLFDVTKNMACLRSSPEDFGQTLAFYGLGSGTYVVLPLLGPSSVRDTVGLVADSFLYPLAWVHPDATKYAFVAHDKTNTISANMKTYQDIKAESFDHYTSMKDVYFQYRQGLEGE